MSSDSRRRHALRTRLLGLSSRVARHLDGRVRRFILELVPAEDGIPIPGLMGFIGCYFRQLLHLRPPGAAHGVAAASTRRQRALRDTA